MDSSTATTPTTELTAAVLEVLDRKGQPMTASQVRDSLPRRFREQIADIGRCLEDLAGQGRLHAWPAFRSKAPRYATRAMDEAAHAVLTQLLGQQAFTRPELILAVCREVPGLPQERCGQILDQVLTTGQVRKLPPRLGGTNHLLGTPHPRAYLAPLFDNLGKSLARLFPRLETEGVSRSQVLEEANALWLETVQLAEQEAGIQAPQGQLPEAAAEEPASTSQEAISPHRAEAEHAGRGGENPYSPPTPP
jgi:hypothetical protein